MSCLGLCNCSFKIFIDSNSTVLELKATFSRRIIGSFFRTPRAIRSNMVNVMRFTFGFNNPHRDRRIRQMTFIKMKDSFLSDNVQNLLHGNSLL